MRAPRHLTRIPHRNRRSQMSLVPTSLAASAAATAATERQPLQRSSRMATASGASSMPPSPMQFSRGHHDATPNTFAAYGGTLLFLGILLATLLLLASSTLQPAGSGAATITPPSAMPPTGTPTLLSSPTSDGGGARLLDSRTIDDSMLDMSRQTSSAGSAGARWTRFFTNFFSIEPSTPLYLNAAPSPSQAANLIR